MPWSSGSFTRTDGTRTGSTVWQQAKAALVKILALDHDTHDQDLATGINNCLTKDGQNKPTANIDFNGKKITNIADGANSGECLHVGQIGNGINLTGGKLVIDNADTTITVSSSGISVNVSALNINPVLSFRNKIIGGNFATNRWTKGTSVAVASTVSSSSTPDNWKVSNQTDGAITVSRITGFADQSNGRFSSYACKINVATADTSIGAGQYAIFQQNIEASNIANIGFGVGGTRDINISYLLKSNVTGTMCMFFTNALTDRCYIKEVSVTGSDTVQLVNFSIPVDTSGTWNTLEGTLGLKVGFVLAGGSTYQGTKEDWTQNNKLYTSNQTNFLATQNNYIALDLVQVEYGNVATPFEYRDIGTEKMLQQRYLPCFNMLEATAEYFAQGSAASTTVVRAICPFKVKTRVVPTGLTISNVAHIGVIDATDTYVSPSTNVTFGGASKDCGRIVINVASGLTAYRPYDVYLNTQNSYIYFTGAEL